ncbi:DNA N-6-adenine-methyltransferase [Sphingobium baderi]|uniref:DNA N-6-adenine-methyltransferase n=1 Tax=Sphingobium baderi TaxID=1332080 RepID=UPI002B41780D|nr:DNA N-6-adenine-methyltransferase [Sphingobium baderi]WRD78707.1 DNA N-6-adenine-methyltransferase [Sphingobium baderi]
MTLAALAGDAGRQKPTAIRIGEIPATPVRKICMITFSSRTTATRDDWQTPESILSALGKFDLDPCANIDNPTRCAASGFTVDQNGLARAWEGRVWLNPPYGGEAPAKTWLLKLAQHGNGIALIPPRVGAIWFHDIVLSTADAILFLRGRVAFIDPAAQLPVKGNNADSILVAYGSERQIVRALRPRRNAVEAADLTGRHHSTTRDR